MSKKMIVKKVIQKDSDKVLLKKHIICRGDKYIVTFKYTDGSETRYTKDSLVEAKGLAE